MSIESKASSTQTSYGEWVTKTYTVHVSSSMACTRNTSGSQTFRMTPSGSVSVTGMTAGHVYQMYSPSVVESYSNHQHKNDYIYGTFSSVSEGSWSITTSSTTPFTFTGSNYPTVTISYPVSVSASAVNIGTSSYPVWIINGSVSCSYDVTIKCRYREIFNYTDSQKMDTMNDNIVEGVNTSKGILSKLIDFFGSFFQNLIDAVIGLFVPSSEEMSDLFGQLNDFFSERFGFLYAPFDYIIQLLGVFTTATGSTVLTFPGFSIMGYEVWPDITYDLADDPLVGQILGYVRMGTGVLLAGYFIMFLQDFFKERFGSG